jgi:3'(2'), 5'-bisphosphate nucleotidase
MTLTEELDVASRLARAAGEAALAFYGRISTEYEGTSPVTDADRASNRVIVEGLQKSFPADAILSEESADTPARLSASRVWIVDPLDGTKEFIARNGEFSIMIGLAIDGRAVLGVVYRPEGDVLFAAASGQGAYVERAGQRTRLECAGAITGAPRLVGSRSHNDPLIQQMSDALGITDVKPSGSVGLKCGLIAENERDLYVHPVPYLKEWDTCAPEVVLREAGGWVSDCNGEPLRYNKPRPVQPHGILACVGCIRDNVLRGIQPLYTAAQKAAAS